MAYDADNDERTENARQRGRLGTWVVQGGTFVIVALCALVAWAYWNAPTPQDRASLLGLGGNLVTGVISLVGAWVGAVIAFYFARENFEAAARASRDAFAQATTTGVDIEAILVEAEMRKISETFHLVYALAAPKEISGILEEMSKAGGGPVERLVLLDAAGSGVGVIHRSALNEYARRVTEEAQAAGGPMPKPTLADYVQGVGGEPRLRSTVAYVARGRTLGEARREMDKQNRLAKCSDVFVTADGSSAKKVEGWLTDKAFARYSTLA